jgi:preprotein translocase subunit YajC
VPNAFAQTPEGAGGPPVVYNVGFLLLLVGIFYFLLLRPEQRRRREHDRLLAQLKRNDQVVMTSGIHGRVMGLGEKVITVEIAPRVQIQVERSAIQSVQTAPVAEAREKEREKS